MRRGCTGHVAAEITKPWEAEGVSRATWYRRRRDVVTETDRARTMTRAAQTMNTGRPDCRHVLQCLRGKTTWRWRQADEVP